MRWNCREYPEGIKVLPCEDLGEEWAMATVELTEQNFEGS